MTTRWLSRLLVLLLCPILVFTAGSNAQAAVAYGTPATTTFGVDNPMPGDWWSCSLVAYWVVNSSTDYHLKGKVSCKYGWGVPVKAPGLRFDMTDTNKFCGGHVDVGDNPTSTDFPFDVAAISSVATPCVVSQVCWTLTVGLIGPDFGHSEDRQGCVPFTLGAPPSAPATGTCAYGASTKPTIGALFQATYWRQNVQDHVVGSPPQGYMVYAITVRNGRSDDVASRINPGGIGYDLAIRYPNSGGADYLLGDIPANNGNSGIVGYGYVAINNANPTWGHNTGTNTYSMLPQEIAYGMVGVNDANRCSYYWGVKIAVVPDSDIDEPIGPITGADGPTEPTVTAPVTETDDTCSGFSLTDPLSWAGAGICELVKAFKSVVGVMGDLLEAVLGLAQALLDGLSDLLNALFVPSEGAFSDAMDSVQGAADTGDIGNWKDTATSAFNVTPDSGGSSARTVPGGGVAPRSSGGCAGPSFTWDKLASVGLPTSIQPLNACSGTGATMAGWSHLLLTVLIGVGGVLKLVQMIFAGLGFVKQTNILTGADWTSDRFS
jgi:hypothetical protein